MRSRSVLVAALLTGLSVGFAVFAHVRVSGLRQDSQWLLARANAEAAEYASSFNPAHADQQMATFEERAVLIRRIAGWERGQMLGVLGAVVGLFASYILYLFRRLREQLIEGAPDLVEASSGGPPLAGHQH